MLLLILVGSGLVLFDLLNRLMDRKIFAKILLQFCLRILQKRKSSGCDISSV